MTYCQNFEFFLTRTQKRISWHCNSDQKVIFLSQTDSEIFDYLNLKCAQLLSYSNDDGAENNISDCYNAGAYVICVYLHGVPVFSAVFPESKNDCDDVSKQTLSLLAKTVVSDSRRLSDNLGKLLDSFSNQGALYFLFDFSYVSNSDDRDLFLRSAFESPIRSFVFLPGHSFLGFRKDAPIQAKNGLDFASFFLFAFFSFTLFSFLFSSVYFSKSIFLGLPFALLFFLLFGLFVLFFFADESFFLRKSAFLKILFFGEKRVGSALLGILLCFGMTLGFFKFGILFQDGKAFSLSFLACLLFIPLYLFLLRFFERNKIPKRNSLN